MSERTEYAPGEFCWVDLSTTDVDGALAFYGELLGVEAKPAPGDPEETGGYGFLTKDGKMVAGYGPTQREGQPSAWSSYIKVEDAEATAEKVKEIGGDLPAEMPAHWQVYFMVEKADEAVAKAEGMGGRLAWGPIDVPTARLAVLVDPQGAPVSILESNFPESR
jgi:predicted enzyme related to lactoylglutathione lyase